LCIRNAYFQESKEKITMPGRYIKRTLEEVLQRAVREFPAVVLTGPRQSGKTTLLKHLFAEKYRYVSLELPDVRAAAAADPRGFIDMYAPPVIFDEVQYAPNLLPYIKEKVDAERDQPGQFLLSGSQNLLLAEGITESLAGRAAMLRLLPLSRREAEGRPQAPLPWESKEKFTGNELFSYRELWMSFLRGGYPELLANPQRDIHLWHASYVQTYLERDVRTLRQVGDLTQFQHFLRALAARSAQLLKLAELARDLGVAVNTAKAWLSVLEATYQVIVLRPYLANIGKRLVKTPKIYFTDVGTLCYLAGLRDPDHAASGPMGGAIFETAVLSEVVKTLVHRGLEPQVYFWRTTAGTEVDIVVESDGKLVPIEVKLSATPRPAMASGIKAFQQDFGERAAPGYVVHLGDVTLPLGGDVTALPFALF
jgi:predicted AAA+ superfamily ATPase